jgi:hypothetical protein
MRTLQLVVLGCALAGTAHAESRVTVRSSGSSSGSSGEGLTLHAGRPLGNDNTTVFVQGGWPGISVGMLRGVTDQTDLGGQVAFNYGVEGIVTAVNLGFKAQGLLHVSLLHQGPVSLGFHFEPGVMTYFIQNNTMVAAALPIRLAVGLAFNPSLVGHFSTELPLYLTFGGGGGAVLPLLFGGGVEYSMGKSFGLSFLARLGPSFDLRENGQTQLAFEALVGVVYRI